MIISQLNLLLSLVNGLIDINAIQQKKYQMKRVAFKPLEVFEFIQAMFANQMMVMNTTLDYHQVSVRTIENALNFRDLDSIEQSQIPRILFGDELRLK